MAARRQMCPYHTPFPFPFSRFGNTIQNDEWQTSQQSWEEISHWFANFKQKCIWQPFYYDGKCAEYLRQV